MKRITLFISIALVLLVPLMMLAGNLDSPADLGNLSSAMYTLQDIFNLLDSGTEATKSATFDEPGSGPGSTGKSLDDVYELIDTNYLAKNHARVPKTGQTQCWDASGNPIACSGSGQDGDLQKGVDWPSPRFTDNSDGTVTDNLTGLIWLKNANVGAAQTTWATAFSWVTELNASGTMNGNGAGDTSNGGGHQTDWRLPNRFELESLLDLSQYNPCLPSGHPFTGVQSDGYWSSSTYADDTDYAWGVGLNRGDVNLSNKSNSLYVWPVRGGQ